MLFIIRATSVTLIVSAKCAWNLTTSLKKKKIASHYGCASNCMIFVPNTAMNPSDNAVFNKYKRLALLIIAEHLLTL